MKAILWKEWRESWRWALLGCGALIAALIAAKGFAVELVMQSHRGFVLESSIMQWTTFAGFAALAFVLGVRATLAESLPDAWAFLVHRPMTMTRIWFAKVIVGLSTYAVAATIPFVAVVAWVATPGNVPGPFYWPMALPGIADLLGGIPYYFAGMLVGSRQVRWYGSRLVPVGLALLGSLIVARVPWFVGAVATAAVTSAIAGTAAWTSFARSARPSLLGSLALSVQLLASFLCLSTFVVLLVLVSHASARIEVTRDGHPVVSGWRAGRFLVIDLVDPTRYSQITDPAEPLPDVLSTVTMYPRERWSDELVDVAFIAIGDGGIRWFYSNVERLLLGYDVTTLKRVRCLGPRGPSSPGESSDPFDGTPLLTWDSCLAFTTAIYAPDLANESLRLIDRADPNEPFVSVWPQSSSSIYASTGHSLRWIDLESTAQPRIVTLPIPPELEASGEWCVGRCDDRNTFMMLTQWQSSIPTAPIVMFELADDGTSVSGREIAVNVAAAAILTDSDWQVPTAMAALMPCSRAIIAEGGSRPVGVALVSALACAAAMLLITTRYDLGRVRLAWVLPALAFGPLIIATFFSVSSRSPREACPGCSKLRVVTRAACEHCGIAFSAPARDGTEILIAS